jgi:hypothetical protein
MPELHVELIGIIGFTGIIGILAAMIWIKEGAILIVISSDLILTISMDTSSGLGAVLMYAVQAMHQVSLIMEVRVGTRVLRQMFGL